MCGVTSMMLPLRGESVSSEAEKKYVRRYHRHKSLCLVMINRLLAVEIKRYS